MKDQFVRVRVEEGLRRRIDAVVRAARMGTRSAHMRRALEEYVAGMERELGLAIGEREEVHDDLS